MRRLLLAIALLAASPMPSAAPAVVTITGALVHPATLTASDIAALPHVSVSAVEHDGSTSHYDGVLLTTLLQNQGAPDGAHITGAAASTYLVVKASDGYVALFSLAELNTKDARCAPLLADRRNGAAIGPDLGPFRVIAPCDPTHARWVRNVVVLVLSPQRTSGTTWANAKTGH